MENIEIDYKVMLSDREKFARYYAYKRQLSFFVVLEIYIALLSFARFFGQPMSVSVIILKFFIGSVIVAIILFMRSYSQYKKLLSGNAAEQISPEALRKIVLSDDCIRIERDGQHLDTSYSVVKVAGITKDHVFFIVPPLQATVIPIEAFSSFSAASYFSSVLMLRTKQRSFYYKKTPGGVYFLGLLCLIPLIGAFVGLALILIGLFQYKNKWLALIGTVGIFVTIMVYGSLFYQMQYGNFFRQNMASIAQSQVNDLMKKVEFYKLQHGEYPDSLIQVVEGEKFTGIADILLTGTKRGQPHNYHYRRIGNKYTLFSVGIDGVPYTKDDIYPSVALADTSKFGLVRDKIWDPYHNLVPYAPRRR